MLVEANRQDLYKAQCYKTVHFQIYLVKIKAISFKIIKKLSSFHFFFQRIYPKLQFVTFQNLFGRCYSWFDFNYNFNFHIAGISRHSSFHDDNNDDESSILQLFDICQFKRIL